MKRADISHWGLSVRGLALLGILLSFGHSYAQDMFAPPVYYPVGANPRDVASGYLNSDEYLDLVVVNELSGSATVLLNNGNGSFQPSLTYPVGSAPRAVTVARIDNDEHPDIVVTNSGSASISVLINNGDGTFAPAVSYSVGASPWGIFAEDLDGDQHIDVAVVNWDSRTFSVLLNNGDGTLSLSGTYAAAGFSIRPSWLTGADFDGDHDVDIAVVKNYHNLYFNQGYVEVFVNDGEGGFSSSRVFTLGLRATTPMAADLDGDQDIDLAVSGTVLSVMMNDGTGTLADPVAHFSGASGRAICADLDCDNDFDFATSQENYGDTSFVVILNNGDATFASPATVDVGPNPKGITAGDFDGDCDLDIAVAVLGDDVLAVTMNIANPSTGVGNQGTGGIVSAYQLDHNHPNPFNPATTIQFGIPKPGHVILSVHDIGGRQIALLARGHHNAGEFAKTWDGRDDSGREIASGVYFARLQAGDFTAMRKMVLLK